MKRVLMLLAFVVSAHHAVGGVASYIRFEENGGAVAQDETGLMDGDLISFTSDQMLPGGGDTYGRGWSTDTPYSTIPQTGEANATSLRMNGGSAYIDLSNYNDLLLGYSFTIEMFIKPEGPLGSVMFGLSPGAGLGLTLFEEGDGTLSYQVSHMGVLDFGPLVELQLDEWQHVAYVKRPGEYSIYVDGDLVVNETLAAYLDGPYNFPGTGTIGDRTIGGDSGTFRGWIDEFRISDEALSPSQFLNAAIPEPGTLGLLLFGAAGLAWRRQRK